MEDGERKEFISRIGTFFLLVGFGLTVLFVASDLSGKTNFTYFLFGLASLGYGFYLKRVTAPPPKPSTRFEGIRKFQQKRREAQAKKEAAKKDQKKK
jgi:hypothetical protein